MLYPLALEILENSHDHDDIMDVGLNFGRFASKKCEDQQTFYMFVIYERIWLTGWWFQIIVFCV